MNPWPPFEELLPLTGAPYQSRRDALLRATPELEPRLGPIGDIQPWKARIQALVLLGWREHGALYGSVLAELDSVDVEWERKKITGIAGVWEDFALRAHQDYGAKILPLCWESILKQPDWPAWKLITFFRMMEVVPDADSVEPLVASIETCRESSVRDVAAQALERQPALKVRAIVRARLLVVPPPDPATAEVLQRVLRRVEE